MSGIQEEVVVLGRWQRCRREVQTAYGKSCEYCRQESQLFSRIYSDVHKDDQWGTVRQVAASIATGITVGCSIVVPLYVLYKSIHGLTLSSDVVPGVGVGGIGGALATTYKVILSPAIRRWSGEPRPLKPQ